METNDEIQTDLASCLLRGFSGIGYGLPGDRRSSPAAARLAKQSAAPTSPIGGQPPDANQPQPVPLDNPNPPAQFKLTGIWESQTQTAYGVVYSQLILELTRTFSQQVTLGNLLTYDVGRYEVGDGFIHFVVENHEPKEYLGKQMSWLTSFTYFYTPIDENSMLL